MFENIRLAFQGIWSHKMRSFLTMLGIIIGIASIIAIVSTIKGTSEQIKEDLIGSGNNTVQCICCMMETVQYDIGLWFLRQARPHRRFFLMMSENDDQRLGSCRECNSTFYYSSPSAASVYYNNT